MEEHLFYKVIFHFIIEVPLFYIVFSLHIMKLPSFFIVVSRHTMEVPLFYIYHQLNEVILFFRVIYHHIKEERLFYTNFIGLNYLFIFIQHFFDCFMFIVFIKLDFNRHIMKGLICYVSLSIVVVAFMIHLYSNYRELHILKLMNSFLIF